MTDMPVVLKEASSLDMDLMARMRILEGALGLPRWSLSRSGQDIRAALVEVPRQHPDIHPNWFLTRDFGLQDAVLRGAQAVLRTHAGEATAEEVAQNMAAGLSITGDPKDDVYGYVGKQKSNAILSGQTEPKEIKTTLFGYAKQRAIDVLRKEQRHRQVRETTAPTLMHTEEHGEAIPADVVLDRTPMDVILTLLDASTPEGQQFRRWVYRIIQTRASDIERAVMEAILDKPDSTNAELGRSSQVVALKGAPISGQMAGRHRDSVIRKVQQEMKKNPSQTQDWLENYLEIAQLGYGGGSLRLASQYIAARYRIRRLLQAMAEARTA